MADPDRNHLRVYYSKFRREFPDVWADAAQLGTWVQLMAIAEQMWPDRPEVPRAVRGGPLTRLVDAGVVAILPGHHFAMRGLDAERTRRSDAGRNAAALRWHSEGNAEGNADAMPSKSKSKSRAEIKGDEPTPLTPRRIVHLWLTEHGAHVPTGWVNGVLNELVKVYGSEPILELWSHAPSDVRTSKQFVQYAEKSLSPGVHGKAGGGHTRTAQEVEDAFH